MKPNYKIRFAWIPSHVGIMGNEMADRLAHDAAIKGTGGHESITISQFKTQFENEYLESVKLRSNTQRNESNSIKHYDLFREVKHGYGKNKHYTGPCDRMAARIRLGYRRIWQIQYEGSGIIHEEYSKCTLCNHPLGNTLD